MDDIMKIEKHNGLSLIEILIGLAILIIIVTLSFSSFIDIQKKFYAQQAISKLKTALKKARQAAIYQQENTLLCSARRGLVCNKTTDWQQQIIVFFDKNNNKKLDPKTEQLIYRFDLPKKSSGQLKSNYHTQIRFNQKGMTANPTRFSYCQSKQGVYTRHSFTLSMSGRLSKTQVDNRGC